MKIHENYNLSKLNTFGISAKAKFFVEVKNEEELKELFDNQEFSNISKLFLGSGSNILFSKDFDGLVILNKLKGIEIIKDDNEYVFVKSMGGEIWHDFVLFTVEHNLWGIENLSLIPGTVGAAPVQNIGAYGVEIKDALESVEVFDTSTGEKKILSKEECKFGYRESVFKNEFKDRYFITAVIFKLNKTKNEKANYKALQEYLENNSIIVNSPKDISNIVSTIRKSKVPDPAVIPNAGSFFKNVFVSEERMRELLTVHPEMPYLEEETLPQSFPEIKLEKMKIPAGWLIEQCGWKGEKIGNVGVYDKQALILVNYGKASGGEILNLANSIIKDVKDKFGLELVPEVNLI
ncbi:MAG: UDP-N-acetylmuramate dehydrogenase [bacterium]